MDFNFTPDQDTLRNHIRQLLDEVCPPAYAERCDNEGKPPREAYDALAKHGWFGLSLPTEYGGMGGSAIDLAILLGRSRSAFRRAWDLAVPHAHLRRLRGDPARHAGAESDIATQGAARRIVVLSRPDRAAIRLRRRVINYPRDRD